METVSGWLLYRIERAPRGLESVCNPFRPLCPAAPVSVSTYHIHRLYGKRCIEPLHQLTGHSDNCSGHTIASNIRGTGPEWLRRNLFEVSLQMKRTLC